MRRILRTVLCGFSFFLISGYSSPASAGCIGQETSTNFKCGDTIIESCTMNEDLTTTSNSCFTIGANDIVLDGNGHRIRGPYVLDGSVGTMGKGIGVTTYDNVTIKNFTIDGFYWGIMLSSGTSSCTVKDNTVSGAQFGIELSYSTGDTVLGNTITGSQSGIKLNNATQNTVSQNSLSDGRYSFLLYPGAHENRLENNRSTSNQYDGIRVIEAERNVLSNNVITGNGWDGIYLWRGPGTVIRYNEITNNAYNGISIQDCVGSTVEYNKVSENTGSGVQLYSDAPDNILLGNKLCGNGNGTSAFDAYDEGGNRGNSNTCGTSSGYTDDNASRGCAYTCGCGCDTGTTVYDCGDTITSSCTLNCDLLSFGTCLTVRGDGIIVDGNGHAIHGNGSGTAISAIGTTKTRVRNFKIDTFQVGISLIPKKTPPTEASTQNQVLNNRIDNTSVHGLYLDDSTANSIENNIVSGCANGYSLQSGATGNSLSNNMAARNTVDGFYFSEGADLNTLSGNTSCASGNLDVNNLARNSGTGTTCLHTGGTYNDIGKTGCTWACGLCPDGTFFGECSLQKPKYCMEGTLLDDCVRCGCSENTCNVETGACEAVPPPDGLCVGVTKTFACGDSVTESCTLNGHMASKGNCFTITANNVTIDGAGYSITGDRTGTALSTVVHDNIVIRNLHVKNFYFGIKLYFSKNSLIEDCSVMDNEGPGITLETHTQNTTVRRNTVRLNDARGIYINGAENNTIQANVVTENNRGIYLINNSTGNTITNNTVNDNQSAGIVLNGCTNNTLSGNYLARNTVEGLALYDQSDANIIQANNIRHHPQAGIIVSESDGNTFADNLVTDIAQDGIYLYLSTNNQLTGNTFCDNGDGVTSFDIDDAGANSGSNNMCRNAHNYDDTDAAAGGCARECAACGCDTGTVIYRCGDTLTQSCTMTCSLTSSGTCFTIGADDLTINGGNFGLIGNHQYDTYGIYALGKKNLTVKNLEVYDFFGGIYLESVTGSTLASNKVHSNDQGIMLAFSSNNQLTNNVVYTNENAGILLAYGSGGNVVSGNSADGNGFGIRLLFNADLNDLLNNTIRNSTINGIYLDFDTNENDLQSNTICSNPVDIYEDGSNGGDGNACATTQNWDDTGTSGCTKSCEPKRVKALPWILMLLDR